MKGPSLSINHIRTRERWVLWSHFSSEECEYCHDLTDIQLSEFLLKYNEQLDDVGSLDKAFVLIAVFILIALVVSSDN